MKHTKTMIWKRHCDHCTALVSGGWSIEDRPDGSFALCPPIHKGHRDTRHDSIYAAQQWALEVEQDVRLVRALPGVYQVMIRVNGCDPYLLVGGVHRRGSHAWEIELGEYSATWGTLTEARLDIVSKVACDRAGRGR